MTCRVVVFLAFLTFTSILALPLVAGQLNNYPQCVELPPGTASAVPPGMTAAEWKDQLSAALAPDATMPQICIPDPGLGEYAITNPVDQQEVLYVGYTARDWSRWDSFDIQEDYLCQPTVFGSSNVNRGSVVWGINNGATTVQPKVTSFSSAPLSASASASSTIGTRVTADTYLKAFRTRLGQIFYPRGYVWFRGFARNAKLDWIEEFKRIGRMDMTGALMNASFALNENYNIFRTQRRSQIRTNLINDFKSKGVDPNSQPLNDLVDNQFDALKIDWLKDMPRNQATMDWYERYLIQVTTKLCQDPNLKVPRDPGSSQQINAFGLFEGMDGAGYSQGNMFFYAGDYAYMAGHYLKLMRSSVIRDLRKAMYAQLSALYASYIYRLPYEDRLANQWILRMFGWTATSYYIIRSEAILRSRGEWKSSDGFTSTNWAAGQVTNQDMLTLTETYLQAFIVRLSNYGLTEFLSTYYVSHRRTHPHT